MDDTTICKGIVLPYHVPELGATIVGFALPPSIYFGPCKSHKSLVPSGATVWFRSRESQRVRMINVYDQDTFAAVRKCIQRLWAFVKRVPLDVLPSNQHNQTRSSKRRVLAPFSDSRIGWEGHADWPVGMDVRVAYALALMEGYKSWVNFVHPNEDRLLLPEDIDFLSV